MKKTLSKLISIILAISVAIVPFTFVFAAEEETGKPSYTADCPYIFVHGFMGSTVYLDPSDPNSDPIWPPTGDAIRNAVKQSIWPTLKLLLTRNYKEFGKVTIPVVTEMFSPSFLGANGEPTDKSGVRWSYPEKSTITKTSRLDYVYDWRLDPIETAKGLNDFINYVLDASGCSRVVLECHSYGGVVVTTYAKNFGTEKIKSVVFNSTAVFGETYNGELFTGGLYFDPMAFTTSMKSAVENNKNAKFLTFLFDALYKTGITGALCKVVNHMIDKIGMKDLSLGIIPMFGGWLSIWSMIPDDAIEDAYKFVFNFCYKDDPTDRSGLIAKVKAYNEQIRPYKAETLRKINETSNLYVIARYGYSGMLLTKSWQNETDVTIDVKYASFGATVAKHGETLSADYLKNVDPKYISPEKNIDASTAMFPQQTWYINHFTHSFGCADFSEMLMTLLYNDGQATVDTFKQYPRFLSYNSQTGKLDAVK